jgi:hypothetical protein
VRHLDDVAGSLALLWARVYTSGLAPDLREQRRAEIASDVWEHRHEAHFAGLRPSQIGLEIVARWLLGIPADLSWRRVARRETAIFPGGEQAMDAKVRVNWWIVPALVLAALLLVTGVTSLDPGWIPPAPSIDPFAVVVVVLGVAVLLGIALRHRLPKLAGLLILSGAWFPLFTPAYDLIITVFGRGRAALGWPGSIVELIAAAAAILAAVGAIQNMARRPTRGRAQPV